MTDRLKNLRTCRYETLLLTHLLRLCELALLEAQPVWARSLQIFSSENAGHRSVRWIPAGWRNLIPIPWPRNISSARTPPTAVRPGSRSNLDSLTATRFCRALPGRFKSAQGGSAKAYVHKPVHKRHENDPRGRTSGVISAGSGDRIRTCDLWVMS